MITPIWFGRVLPGGLLALDRPRDYAKYVRSLRGCYVEVVCRKKRIKRSLDQNAYLHAVPLPLLADYWGEDIGTTKLLVLGECFGWKETRGQRLPIKAHTSQLTTAEFSQLIEWLPPWAMTQFNVSIPLPNEVAA